MLLISTAKVSLEGCGLGEAQPGYLKQLYSTEMEQWPLRVAVNYKAYYSINSIVITVTLTIIAWLILRTVVSSIIHSSIPLYTVYRIYYNVDNRDVAWPII